MTSKTSEAIGMTALALSELHNVVAVALMAVAKRVNGNTKEARAEVLRGLDMIEKVGASINALLETAGKLAAEG